MVDSPKQLKNINKYKILGFGYEVDEKYINTDTIPIDDLKESQHLQAAAAFFKPRKAIHIRDVPELVDLSIKTPYRIDDAETQKRFAQTKPIKDLSHMGQRKLLLSEVQFFVNYWDEIKDESLLILYVGAAAGFHIPTLITMFSKHKNPKGIDMLWHLYDLNKFSKVLTEHKKEYNVEIFNEYFTDELARKYAKMQESGKRKIILISDIRTAEGAYEDDFNSEAIIENQKMQTNWYKIIKPLRALLKFRMTYTELKPEFKYLQPQIRNIDKTPEWIEQNLNDEQKKQLEILKTTPYSELRLEKFFEDLAGDIYYQEFPPRKSSETRLVPNIGQMKKYSDAVWEDHFYFFNAVLRYCYYDHNIPDFCHCFSCSLEAKILTKYVKLFEPEFSEEDVGYAVYDISQLISKNLDKPIFPKDIDAIVAKIHKEFNVF